MAKLLEIQTGENNPILRTKSVRVGKINAVLKKFAKDMRETMIAKDGLGLAAPQVGENLRMIIVTMNYGASNAIVMTMINPEILSHGEEVYIAEEGCLSLPKRFENVERFKEVVVEFTDLDGGEHTLKLANLDARVVQHEVDHLDGVLFIDRVRGADKRRNAVVM
ncbi:MAG: peptide deformylase [Candidatus Gracilibacteria bacterium]|jgi:peptide deformylase